MKHLKLFAALCCAAAVLAACDKENEPTNGGQNDNNPPMENPDTVPAENPDTLVTAEYTLTVLSSDETLGTVTGSGRYANGTKVAVAALPNGGSEFVSWSDTSSMELEREITLTSDSTITATFRAAGGDGSVLTVAEAYNIASSLSAGATTSDEVTVIGYAAKIQAAYSSTYGNVSFYMSDDASQTTGENGKDFLAYRVKGTDAVDVKRGDKVKVVAKLTNYKGNTPETVAGGSVEILRTFIQPEWVDLGLPSGVKWATCNVGATTSDYCGYYFAWGEVETKKNYDWSTYKYGKANRQLTKYCTNADYGLDGFTDGKTVLDPEDDAATQNWGDSWRMPTGEEWEELIDYCRLEFSWHYDDLTAGWIVTGRSNGNSIFIPIADRYEGIYRGAGNMCGCYWSSSLYMDSQDLAQNGYLYTATTPSRQNDRTRCYGQRVRPVLNEN